jgi:hypothetical protein
MFELRRQRAVAGHRGPAVGKDFDVRPGRSTETGPGPLILNFRILA